MTSKAFYIRYILLKSPNKKGSEMIFVDFICNTKDTGTAIVVAILYLASNHLYLQNKVKFIWLLFTILMAYNQGQMQKHVLKYACKMTNAMTNDKCKNMP